MTSLSNLSPAQIRALARLHTSKGNVGKERRAMWLGEVGLLDGLAALGLVTTRRDEAGLVWYRLNEAGRRAREEGGATPMPDRMEG